MASPLPARRLRLPGAALGPALVLLLVLALAGPVAHAQDRPLGLAQAWRAALVADPTLRAARARAEAVAERLEQAHAAWRPQVSATLNTQRNNLDRTQTGLLDSAAAQPERYPSSSQVLQLRQALIRPTLGAGLDLARQQLADANALLDNERQLLGKRLMETYVNALQAQEVRRGLDSQILLAETQLKAARMRLESGHGMRTEIDEVLARLDMLQADVLAADHALESAHLQLGALIQQPVGQVRRFVPERMAPLNSRRLEREDWQAQAEARNPEIQALQARVGAAQAIVRQAESAHWPTLDAVAQWSHSRSENVTQPQTGYTSRQIGLQLNIPLYAGGATQSAVRQARADLVVARETLEASRRDLALKVFEAWRGITDGSRRITALEAAVRSAQQIVLSSQKSYEGGVRTLLDVLDAQQRAQAAQKDLVSARLAWAAAQVQLRALAGSVDDTVFEAFDAMLE